MDVATEDRRPSNIGPVILTNSGALNEFMPGVQGSDSIQTPGESTPVDSPRQAPVDPKTGLRPLELFGGAIKAALPPAFIDVSLVRDVPDNQEVYVDENTNVSAIVEILEATEEAEVQAALEAAGVAPGTGGLATYLFLDLAEANETEEAPQVLFAEEHAGPEMFPKIPGRHARASAAGRQRAAKRFREGATAAAGPAEDVAVYLAVLRLAELETDILVTVNVPLKPTQSGNRNESLPEDNAPTYQSFIGHQPGENESGATGGGSTTGLKALQAILQSFEILDWSLFC